MELKRMQFNRVEVCYFGGVSKENLSQEVTFRVRLRRKRRSQLYEEDRKECFCLERERVSLAYSSTESSPGGLEPMSQRQRNVGGDREVARGQGRLVLPGQAWSLDCILSIAVATEKNDTVQ